MTVRWCDSSDGVIVVMVIVVPLYKVCREDQEFVEQFGDGVTRD